MKIYIGSDHRGYGLKRRLKDWLVRKRYSVEDVGFNHLEYADDYPIISEKLGNAVVADKEGLGILLCGSGVGASAAVNKVQGIRGAIGVTTDQVSAGRHDDDMNVLILPADIVGFSAAKSLSEAFLKTPYAKEERYERRLGEIREIESK